MQPEISSSKYKSERPKWRRLSIAALASFFLVICSIAFYAGACKLTQYFAEAFLPDFRRGSLRFSPNSQLLAVGKYHGLLGQEADSHLADFVII